MKHYTIFLTAIIFSVANLYSQEFEPPKPEPEDFDDVKVEIGADFALQYQALDHSADTTLIPLGTGINLPTANFTVIGRLAPGVKVNLTTYLSSRHHVEAWVKGGYLLMDRLPFLGSKGIDRVMNYLTLKVGVMELNFGDAHFFRSDNGEVINNPFVGNLIMDAFTTAPAFEVLFRNNGIIGMLGLTTGSLRPQLVSYSNFSGYTAYNAYEELAVYWKAGYDSQLSDDLRIRATLSGYHSSNNHFGSLYNGDRTGSRFNLVMQQQTNSSSDVDPSSGHTTGRWGPGFHDELNSYMLNVFLKYSGLELFGTFESAAGTSPFGGAEFNFTQYAIQGLYRFGNAGQYFLGGKYNTVSNSDDLSVNRIEAGAGWHMTKNVVIKLDYVNQEYTNFIESYGEDAGFNGIMFEAGISF